MKKTYIYKISMTVFLTLSILSCSKGFQSQSDANFKLLDSNSGLNTGDSPQNPDQIDPNLPPAQAIDKVQMKSLVEDSSQTTGFNGAIAFDFDKLRGEFIIMIPLPANVIFTPSGSFPNYPDIYYGPMFDSSGKMKIAVRVPVKYIIKGLEFIPPSKLPNGDPLPAMPAGAGELPALGLSFPTSKTQLTLYIGVNAVGLFATLPEKASLPIPFNITLPLKNQDKSRTFGHLTYVTAKGTFPSGLFIATVIPAQFARILEDYFHL
jgi:hypothetical protein